MKKMKLMSALLALMLLLSAAMPSFAMTDAEWVWYLLRDYGGSNGKNGCYLHSDGGYTHFTAAQVDEESPKSARLKVFLDIVGAGDQVAIELGIAVENGNTGSYLTGYEFTNLTINVDGDEFFWRDMVSNEEGRDGWYCTVPGLTLLIPEIALFQKMKNADKISITATANGRYGRETFRIDDADQCSNFKEFSRIVLNYNLYDYCNVGFMNGLALIFPMHSNISSSSFYYGQKLHVINCNSSISFRSKPDPDAPRYCMIPKGETVTFLGDAGNGFFKIEYEGWTGYASSLYLGW